MCGIIGVYYFKNNDGDTNEFKSVTQTLKHRGPDQEGFYFDNKVFLGHKRLSIIDLSEKGKQPLTNENNNIQLICNGEIYNYTNLKEKLIKKGHKFMSDSDSEVIIHAYEEYGINCVELFNGMFAFALWDKKKQIFILARDPIGIKPIYYLLNNNKLIFSSEINTLKIFNEFKNDIDYISLNEFLAFQYIRGPRTIFNNIRKILPGELIIINNNKVTFRDYSYNKRNINSKFNINELKRILALGIKKQLISDVPLGVFLSGGIDSSIIVANTRKLLNNVKTFSVGFDNCDEFNELKYARIVADKFNTEHYEIYIKPPRIYELKKIIYQLDEPLADFAAIPTYYLAKFAKKRVTVALSGEGADELFGGYNYYKMEKRVDFLRRIPRFNRTLMLNIMKKINKITGRKTLESYLKHSFLNPPNSISCWQNIFSNIERKSIIKKYIEIEKKTIKNKDLFNNLLNIDIKNFLPEDLLMKIDKMTMAHSLEARVPYLDLETVNFVQKIPSQYKISIFNNKIILKNLFKKDIPRTILLRKKQGFNVPINNWMKTTYINELEKIKKNNLIKQYLNENEVESIINKFLNGNNKYERQVWSLLNLHLWFEENEKFIQTPA